MSEQEMTSATEEEEEKFIDELSDEALDRTEGGGRFSSSRPFP